MKAFRHSIVSASVAPLAHRRASRTLATAGVRIRALEHRLAIANGRIAADELTETEIADRFAVLVDLLDQHLGLEYLPDDLRQQLELVAALLGLGLEARSAMPGGAGRPS